MTYDTVAPSRSSVQIASDVSVVRAPSALRFSAAFFTSLHETSIHWLDLASIYVHQHFATTERRTCHSVLLSHSLCTASHWLMCAVPNGWFLKKSDRLLGVFYAKRQFIIFNYDYFRTFQIIPDNGVSRLGVTPASERTGY